MNYLILGATGFIGNGICRHLQDKGEEWKGVSRESKHENIYPVDLVEKDSFSSLLPLYDKNTIIINALGSLKPTDFDKNLEKSFNSNYSMVENIISALTTQRPRKLIHISSAGTVYGESSSFNIFNEQHPLRPIGWYGKMKMFEELMLKENVISLKVPLLIARVTNPFGNTNKPKHGFIDVLLSKILNNERFEAFFDEHASRDFIHIDDLSKVIIKLSTIAGNETINIGSGRSTKLKSILEKVISNNEIKKRIIIKERNKSDVIDSKVDVSKMNKLIGTYDFVCPEEYIEAKLRTTL